MPNQKAVATGCLVSLLALVTAAEIFGVRYDVSASIPAGFYRADPAGNLVEICPEGRVADLSLNYRAFGRRCSDRHISMLKPIVAVEGDSIRVSQQGVAVNGVLLPNSAPIAQDSQGRALPKLWPMATKVQPGEIWVVSSYSDRSFDSRYFGPVSLASVRAHMVPLWTWR